MENFHSKLAEVHRFHNFLQTVSIISAMALLLGLSAELLLGEGAFLWAVFTTVFTLLLRPQVPIKLMMRFYRAQPISYYESPKLVEVVESLALKAKLTTIPKLYYIPSSVTNAFTVGTQSESAIAVTDGLLRRLSTRELTNVLAHEISHLKHHDINVMGLADLVSRLTRLMSSVGLILIIFSFPLFLFSEIELSLVGVMLLIIAPVCINFLQAALSRTREYSADIGAIELTGDPGGLASALNKVYNFDVNRLQSVFTHKGAEPSLLRSHPPTEERVRRLLALQKEKEMTRSPKMEEGFHEFRKRDNLRSPRRHWTGLWY